MWQTGLALRGVTDHRMAISTEPTPQAEHAVPEANHANAGCGLLRIRDVTGYAVPCVRKRCSASGGRRLTTLCLSVASDASQEVARQRFRRGGACLAVPRRFRTRGLLSPVEFKLLQ